MRVKILYCLLILILTGNMSYGQILATTVEGSVVKDQQNGLINAKADKHEKLHKAWTIIKGRPAQNAVLLGMQSAHTSGKHYNQSNKLIGIQYKGYTYGHFSNSYYKDSYYIGVARNIYNKKIYKDFSVGLQYKAGILHGYGDKYPNVGGFSPAIIPAVEFNYKAWGVDITVIPSDHPIFAGSMRLNVDYIANKVKEFKQNEKLKSKTVNNS